MGILRGRNNVSVSALSDRGVRPAKMTLLLMQLTCFSIRSFGSWGEADSLDKVAKNPNGFSIRSFGSWGEARVAAL